jgi:molybdopterin molybdotransferase
MPEFLRLSPPIEALHMWLHALPDQDLSGEAIETPDALGRIVVEDVCAPHPLPEFQRSTMDGYAVRAHDTFGVSESLPGYLTLAGEILMGAIPEFALTPGSCALIHTGGMLPVGADAVVMLEYTQMVGVENPSPRAGVGISTMHEEQAGFVRNKEIEITHPVAKGENTLRVGEDVVAGQVILEAGTKIRPVEIGGCMALGITHLRVANKPTIGIISSGNELVAPEENPHPGQVRDINSYSLAALVKQAGGKPIFYGIVPDNLPSLKATATQALRECSAIIITAGSSASARDVTAEAVASLGNPGVLVHGVNVKPGKPTILAVCNGKAVIGLPGNPVSALVIAELFVNPLIGKLLGEKLKIKASIPAKLTANLPSQAGREDWVAVKLITSPLWESSESEGKGNRYYFAEPVFGKSNLIFSLAAADGLVRIPPEVTGINAGEMVDVILLM